MKKILPVFFCLLLLSGCGGAKKTTDTIFSMDTVMTLTVYDGGRAGDEALAACRSEIYRLNDMLSVTDPDSQIGRFNQGQFSALSQDSYGLLLSALTVAADTEGAYDPTVYPLMKLWGFYADEFTVPGENARQQALSHTGYSKAQISPEEMKITLPQGMGVDLGGIAKGYAAEKVLETMEASGIETAVISLGGNVGLLGTKPGGEPWTVAVEKPDGSGNTIATLAIPGGEKTYCVTSGAYQRYFQVDGVTYHHILDPKTGCPAETDLLSVTIVSRNGTEADALSTALFVMGFDEAVSFWQSGRYDFDLVLITEAGIFASPDLSITADIPVTTLEEGP